MGAYKFLILSLVGNIMDVFFKRYFKYWKSNFIQLTSENLGNAEKYKEWKMHP